MSLLMVGLHYRSAPIEIRERIAVGERSWGEIPKILVSQSVVLATCNRFELYCVAPSQEAQPLLDWLAKSCGLSSEVLTKHAQVLWDEAVIRHLFRVASGLDSMVLGETQILGQLRRVHRTAQQQRTLGSILDRFIQHALCTAKQVRSTTAIGENLVSIAAVCVKLAQRIFPSLQTQTVLFIGAGEMIGLCLRHFSVQKPQRMVMANRTLERAQRLVATSGGEAITLAQVSDFLHCSDVIVSCTGAEEPLIRREELKQAMQQRRQKPMLLLDLAIPRDLEATCHAVPNVFMYSLDNLAQFVECGREARRLAVVDAEAVVQKQVIAFRAWLNARKGIDALKCFRQNIQAQADKELSKTYQRTGKLDPVLQAELQRLVHRLTQKFLHRPTCQIMDALHRQEAGQLTAILQAWAASDSVQED